MRDSTERDLGVTVRSKAVIENQERVDRLSDMIEAGEFLSDDVRLNSLLVEQETIWLQSYVEILHEREREYQSILTKIDNVNSQLDKYE